MCHPVVVRVDADVGRGVVAVHAAAGHRRGRGVLKIVYQSCHDTQEY